MVILQILKVHSVKNILDTFSYAYLLNSTGCRNNIQPMNTFRECLLDCVTFQNLLSLVFTQKV